MPIGSAALSTSATVSVPSAVNVNNFGGSPVTLGQKLMLFSLPVAIASDQGAIPVNATLSAETTKVIGTINIASAQTLATVTTVSALTAITNALPAGTNVIGHVISDSGSVTNATLQTGTNSVGNVGAKDATGSAVPANAFYQGAQAKTALPTAATDGNLTGITSDKFGRQVVVGAIRELVSTQATTISTTGETTIVTAGGAGVFNDLSSIILSNTSATATRVDIRQATGGTVILTFYLPAGDVRGAVFHVPFPQASAANNWTATLATGVTDVRITAQSLANK